MADWITYKLTGADALSAKFKQLSADVQKQVALPAGKAAMDIVLQSAIDRAHRIDDPRTPANIALNIRMLEDKQYYEETGDVKISVGVRKGRGPGLKTWYWYYRELGTSTSRAQPFLRPALNQNLQAVFAEFISAAKFELVRMGIN